VAIVDPETEYEAKWAEYQAVMHRGAWRIGWGFFGVTVGLLPLMWLFIWMVGAGNWENTRFHAPLLMWIAVPLSLVLVVTLIMQLYRKNLELDAVKRRYLAELKALQPRPARPEPVPAPLPGSSDPDSFRDDE
jgi:magnesium-transporting ATPase (P-type)